MEENIANVQTESSYSEPSMDSVDTSSSYQEPAEDTTSNETQESNTIASAETDDGGMSLVKDPGTGKVTLKIGPDNDDTPDEEVSTLEPTELQGEPEQASVSDSAISQGAGKLDLPKYNLDEFSQALANGYIDPNRVPDEYQAQYADYRIRQAIMERQNRDQQALYEENLRRKEIEAQMNPEARIQANKDFYKALEEEASTAALKDLGITMEQLSESEYTEEGEAMKRDYDNALSWHKQRLRGEMQARYQQEQAYKTQQQQIYADIQNFVSQERAKDPNFDAIDRMLATRYQTLPFQDGQVVADALRALQNGTINPRGVQVIQQYFQNCRKEFYAQKNGLNVNGAKQSSKRPPVVENAGQGQQVNRSYRPNYSKLRNATVDQRSAWFNEYFKNKGW